MVTLSVIIPTCDPTRPLKRCLYSIASQPLSLADEVLVVGDTTDGPLPEVAALLSDLPHQFRYLDAGSKAHTWGHDEINLGVKAATGDLLLFQDDDDVFLRGAFDAIREKAQDALDQYGELRPLMFRFVTRFRTLLWGAPAIKEDWVGGHNFIAPNREGRVGLWTPRYQGDYDFIRSTVDLWPNKDDDVVWHTNVLSFARPDTGNTGPW